MKRNNMQFCPPFPWQALSNHSSKTPYWLLLCRDLRVNKFSLDPPFLITFSLEERPLCVWNKSKWSRRHGFQRLTYSIESPSSFNLCKDSFLSVTKYSENVTDVSTLAFIDSIVSHSFSTRLLLSIIFFLSSRMSHFFSIFLVQCHHQRKV